MKKFRYKLEDYLRGLRLYLDYYKFNLFHLIKKPLPLEIKKILIIEQKFIGDIIVATPAIRALKEKFPEAKIDILLPRGMEDILLQNPNINKIYTNLNIIQDNYDLGIILHYGSKKISKWLKKHAKFRIGCTRPLFKEGKGYYLHRKTKPLFKLQHKIDDNLDVLKTIGIETDNKELELYTNKEIKKDSKFLVVICPGVRHAPSHEWFSDRFAQLSDILIEKYKAKIIFIGTEKENELINTIISQTKNKVINTAGKISLQELFALIKSADLLISVDTGPMHIAAAFKTPVIALFGAGNPEIWHPYSKKAVSIIKNNACNSCMKLKCPRKGEKEKECMKAIKIEDILSLVGKIR